MKKKMAIGGVETVRDELHEARLWKRLGNPTLVGCKWFLKGDSLLAGLSFAFGGT